MAEIFVKNSSKVNVTCSPVRNPYVCFLAGAEEGSNSFVSFLSGKNRTASERGMPEQRLLSSCWLLQRVIFSLSKSWLWCLNSVLTFCASPFIDAFCILNWLLAQKNRFLVVLMLLHFFTPLLTGCRCRLIAMQTWKKTVDDSLWKPWAIRQEKKELCPVAPWIKILFETAAVLCGAPKGRSERFRTFGLVSGRRPAMAGSLMTMMRKRKQMRMRRRVLIRVVDRKIAMKPMQKTNLSVLRRRPPHLRHQNLPRNGLPRVIGMVGFCWIH